MTAPRRSQQRPAWRLLAARGLAVAALALATACDRGTAPESSLLARVEGRPERGGVLRVSALRDAALLPPAQWTLAADPADAAVVDTAARTVRPLRAGKLTVRVRTAADEAAATLEVAPPPRVVFDVLRDGNRDVYSVALDGGELRRLTRDAADDGDPTAQGDTVVLTSWRDGAAWLYRLLPGAAAEERLSGPGRGAREAALSPRGGRLAFVREAGGSPRLWTAAADGSGARAATDAVSGALDASPAWSPDGRELVFVSTRAGNADVWRLAADGTLALLAGGSAVEVEPTWSPDGAHVVFVSTRDGNAELYRISLAGGAVERLTRRPGTDGHPAYLADGRIVYAAWVDGVPRLRWLHPDHPDDAGEIPTGPGAAAHPAPAP